MRADELVLRLPPTIPLGCFLPLLVSLPAALANGTVTVLIPVILLSIGFIVLMSAAQLRTPTRLSADGLRIAADRLGNRYHPVIPWERVDRIWTDGRSLRVRLHDPDAIAGPNRTLAAGMRRRRSRRGADLIGPLANDRRTVEEAVTRFGGGRLRLERAHTDPVPGTYDVAIRDNRTIPLLFLLAMLVVPPWSFVVAAFETGGVPWYLPPLAVAVTAVVALIALRVAGPLVAPHIIAPGGLRVRVVHPLAHDLTVPWERVDRIWHGRPGRRPAVLARVHDPDALAGGDVRLRDRMRRNRARYGADLVLRTAGAGMDAAHLALVVRHRSHGTRELEHAG